MTTAATASDNNNNNNNNNNNRKNDNDHKDEKSKIQQAFEAAYTHGMENANFNIGSSNSNSNSNSSSCKNSNTLIAPQKEFMRVMLHAILRTAYDTIGDGGKTVDPSAVSNLSQSIWGELEMKQYTVKMITMTTTTENNNSNAQQPDVVGMMGLRWKDALQETSTMVANRIESLPAMEYGPIPSWQEYEAWKKLHMLDFDVKKSKLISILCELLEVDDLSRLYDQKDKFKFDDDNDNKSSSSDNKEESKTSSSASSSSSVKTKFVFENNQRTPVHLRYYNHPQQQRFLDAYQDFIQTEVAPQFFADRFLVVQKKPTFRCHLPHNRSVGFSHCDRLFGHSEIEINYWLPLTRAYGSNSIRVESAPDVGDFQTVTTQKVGQYVRFFGSRCHHSDTTNVTGDTRVSIDFRVIPYRFYRQYRDDVVNKSSCNASMKFVVGSYFSVYDKETQAMYHDEAQAEAAYLAATATESK